MRAIVVGSGIGGLTAAIALRRVGIDVTVYERAPALGEVGAGISLWANALRALDRIGAGDAVRAAALALQYSEFRVRAGHRVTVAYPAAALEARLGFAPLVAMIHRADLVGALAGCLPAGVARYGFECVGVDLRGDRAAVRFANGHVDEADVVVGADGIRSAVRAALLGPEEPRYAGYTCWRGVCARPAALSAGYVGEWWGRGRRFGITTLPGDRVYWFATQNATAGGRAGDERAHLAGEFAGWADPVPELIATTPPEKVLRNDIVDRTPDPRWASGRVVLIGDAAHPTTPNLGQGGCLAIEDAAVLARHLAPGGDPVRALAEFTAERFPRAAEITRTSWRFGRIGQWQGRFSCWARDAVFGPVMRLAGPGGLLRYAAYDPGPVPDAGAVHASGHAEA
jgi:2-polyprenyl-6-methoxyphenol hydroxylase-like FAD-dependent oxidoreductase